MGIRCFLVLGRVEDFGAAFAQGLGGVAGGIARHVRLTRGGRGSAVRRQVRVHDQHAHAVGAVGVVRRPGEVGHAADVAVVVVDEVGNGERIGGAGGDGGKSVRYYAPGTGYILEEYGGEDKTCELELLAVGKVPEEKKKSRK